MSWAEYWYNMTFHTSIRTTTFRVLYGRDSPHLLHYRSQQMPVSTIDQYLQEWDRVLMELRGDLL